MTINGLTIKEISEQHGLSLVYTQALTQKKGFPDHEMMVGRNKIFSAAKVAKYFASRRTIAKPKRK